MKYRRLDYRSPRQRLRDFFRRWRWKIWRGWFYLKHGRWPVEYFKAEIVRGWDFPFKDYGYSIIFRRRVEPEAPAASAPDPSPSETTVAPPSPTAREVHVEVVLEKPSSPSLATPPVDPARTGAAKESRTRHSSGPSSLSVVQSPAPRDLAARPPEPTIDSMLHSLLHEKKWLSPADRAKLDRAYQMEKHRAGLTQSSDPSQPMRFRRFVPPPRPPEFHLMSNVNRMWYCRMEELWQFRQEDAAHQAKLAADTQPKLLKNRRPRSPKRTKRRKKS